MLDTTCAESFLVGLCFLFFEENLMDIERSNNVTLNDLIEQLVGDLGEDTPEEEAAEPHVEQMNGNTWAIIGNVELYDIEQALDVDIGLDEVDTFTGLVFGELDMIPHDGEQDIEVYFKGLHIHITKVENHQISYATVTKLPVSEENAEKI